VIACMPVQRELAPGGPGSGLRQGRKRFLCSCRLIFLCEDEAQKSRAWQIEPAESTYSNRSKLVALAPSLFTAQRAIRTITAIEKIRIQACLAAVAARTIRALIFAKTY
jgi:hypothetical protein